MNIVDRSDWLRARHNLLKQEKELTRARDALSEARRGMPATPIEKTYTFDTEQGQASLEDLFAGYEQLVLYHFMFAPEWQAGCKMCSFWADSFDGAADHLAARSTSFAVTSNAPLQRLLAYRDRMGWSFRWVSTNNGPFHRDVGVSFPNDDEQGYNYTGRPAGPDMPGMSVFVRLPNGDVGHSYSTYGRGLDILNTAYNILDLTPAGRAEAALDFPMSWVRRRDEYANADVSEEHGS